MEEHGQRILSQLLPNHSFVSLPLLTGWTQLTDVFWWRVPPGPTPLYILDFLPSLALPGRAQKHLFPY